MKLMKYFLLPALAMSLTASLEANAGAAADFPVGLWKTTHYLVNQQHPKAVSFYVCMNADGTWQSIQSQDGMGGRWERSGNSINLTGNGANMGGTGEITLIVPYRTMTGTWQSWSLNAVDKAHHVYTSKWDSANRTNCDLPKQ